MPCQGSQKLSQSSLCLPLYKFSYATVSAESVAPIPWIHISGKSRLFAIFETNPVQLDDGRFEDRQKFKVLQDPEVMVYLDPVYPLTLDSRPKTHILAGRIGFEHARRRS